MIKAIQSQDPAASISLSFFNQHGQGDDEHDTEDEDAPEDIRRLQSSLPLNLFHPEYSRQSD